MYSSCNDGHDGNLDVCNSKSFQLFWYWISSKTGPIPGGFCLSEELLVCLTLLIHNISIQVPFSNIFLIIDSKFVIKFNLIKIKWPWIRFKSVNFHLAIGYVFLDYEYMELYAIKLNVHLVQKVFGKSYWNIMQ